MVKYLVLVASVATLAAGIGFAGQNSADKSSGADQGVGSYKIAATNGSDMFGHYCTPCHGVDGRGHGPIVMQYGAPAVDLTVLARKNHGKFPEVHVVHVLQNGTQILSHTSVEMPVWGPIFGKRMAPSRPTMCVTLN